MARSRRGDSVTMCPPRPAKTPVQALIEAVHDLERRKEIALHRTKYEFKGRQGSQYVWQAKKGVPGESRVEEIRCDVDWFWRGGKPKTQEQAVIDWMKTGYWE